MFGIGIIGCGKIAQVRHIPEYAAHPEAKLVGFSTSISSGQQSWRLSTAAVPTPP